METTHNFRLTFATDLGSLATINIPFAEGNTTGAQVSAAMSEIINSGAVQSAAGNLQSRHSAELVTTHRNDFNI